MYVAIIMKKVFRKYIFIDEKSSNAGSRGSIFGAAAAGVCLGITGSDQRRVVPAVVALLLLLQVHA